jgi:hypothetical protein
MYAGDITILRSKALNPATIVSQNGALYSLAGHMGEWCSFQVFTHYGYDTFDKWMLLMQAPFCDMAVAESTIVWQHRYNTVL